MTCIGAEDAQTIEVMGSTMYCFKVNPQTLHPLTSPYFEPSAYRDCATAPMHYFEWMIKYQNRHNMQENNQDLEIDRETTTLNGVTLKGKEFVKEFLAKIPPRTDDTITARLQYVTAVINYAYPKGLQIKITGVY